MVVRNCLLRVLRIDLRNKNRIGILLCRDSKKGKEKG